MSLIRTRADRDKRAAILEKLNAIKEHEFEKAAPLIVDAFKGCPSNVWWSIDNDIGNAAIRGLAAPWLVRQVRNSPVYGPKLFAGLKG